MIMIIVKYTLSKGFHPLLEEKEDKDRNLGTSTGERKKKKIDGWIDRQIDRKRDKQT